MERELNIIIHQVYQEKPSVKKRKGHFKKSRLLKLGRDSNCISLPSGGWKAQLQPAGTFARKKNDILQAFGSFMCLQSDLKT